MENDVGCRNEQFGGVTMQVYKDELYHYGKLGMKWGQHKTIKTARKDAEEFARAKMFYGTGAGTRRKLIKTTVEARSKDLLYKQEFDNHLAKQDMSKHASKAKMERHAKDAKEAASTTTRGLINASMGNVSRASATAAGIYTVAHITGVDKKVKDYGTEGIKKGADYVRYMMMKQALR